MTHDTHTESEGEVSYDIYLNDPVSGSPIEFDSPHQLRGGTYQIGGCIEAWLNITYNYGTFYYEECCFGERGIRTIYGMTGADSIPILQKAADSLGNDTDPDYWKATEGNAKRPLLQLIAMAKVRPDGVWQGD